MALKRRQINSDLCNSCVEPLESRQFFSATLVQITIPTPPVTAPKHHKPAKPTVVHKKAVSSGEEHAKIGYEIFAK